MTAPLPAGVIGASVAVKLAIDEPFSDRAHRLYRESLSSGKPLQAPPLLPNEVANAIYRRYRRNDLTEARADDAIARFADLRFDIISPPHLAEQAYALAKRHGLGAIYDALYVALARDLDAELWTVDRRLRWIGDHPLP